RAACLRRDVRRRGICHRSHGKFRTRPGTRRVAGGGVGWLCRACAPPIRPKRRAPFQELATVCSGSGSTFFFGFGSPPPGFVFGSPPPGFVIPTPPPEAFATPPPEVLAPPSGSAATVLELLGMMVTIVIGIGDRKSTRL